MKYIYSCDRYFTKSIITNSGGITWVHLNFFAGCNQSIPLEAWILKDKLERPGDFGPMGTLLGVEWALEPDWYYRVLHWHAWIPIDWEGRITPWYHRFNQSVEPEIVREGSTMKYRLKDEWIKQARIDIRDVHECCRIIREKTPYPNVGSLPAHFSFDRLLDYFDSARDAEIVATDARRAVVDGLGFLGWWCESQPEWDDKLPKDIISRIQAYSPVGRKRRGVIFDIHRDWQEMNLPLLVQQGVPVFYPWTLVEATNPRFTRLSPAFLRAYETVAYPNPEEAPVALIHLEDLPDHHKFKDITRFDEFLQNGMEDFSPNRELADRKVGKKTEAFIKDFINWKPRPVLTARERAYCNRHFHGVVYSDNGVLNVLYWCYRLKTVSSSDENPPTFAPMDVDDDESDYGDDEDDDYPPSGHTLPSAVREVYKVGYAPNPGCILPSDAFQPIDIVTSNMRASLSGLALRAAKEVVAKGQQTVHSEPGMDIDPPVPPRERVPEQKIPRPTKENRRRRTEKRREYSSTPSEYAAERRTQQRSNRFRPEERDYRTDHPHMPKGWYVHDSGSEDFYHPSSNDESSSWGQPAPSVPMYKITSMDQARGRPQSSEWVKAMSQTRHLRDRISIVHKPRESQSTASAEIPSHRHMIVTTPSGELQRFIEAFGRWGARVTFAEGGNEVPNDLKWDKDYLKMGVLYVPELSSEVRMRYWANTLSGMHSVSQVLNRAIAHGIEFYLAIPQSNIPHFRPANPTSSDLAAKVFYDEYKEPGLTWGNGGSEFWNIYLVRAREILSRPHGRAAIFAGGPLAWLARRICGDEIVERAMKGPSVQTTIHQAGFIDTETGLLHRYDKLSKSEMLVLYGFLGSQVKAEADEWLFPSPFVLKDTLLEWSGEVTPLLDHIMDDLWRSYSKGYVKTRTLGAWKGHLRGNNHGTRAPSFVPAESDWQDGKNQLTVAFSTSWHRAYLEDLQVPEPYRSITNGL